MAGNQAIVSLSAGERQIRIRHAALTQDESSPALLQAASSPGMERKEEQLLRDLLLSHGPAVPRLLSRQLTMAAIFSLTRELFRHAGLLHSRCSVESNNSSARGT